MIELLRDLGANDPGALFAVGLIFGAIIATLVFAVGFAWDRRPPRPPRVRVELGVNHDRLDAGAMAATTRPTSSARKASRRPA